MRDPAEFTSSNQQGSVALQRAYIWEPLPYKSTARPIFNNTNTTTQLSARPPARLPLNTHEGALFQFGKRYQHHTHCAKWIARHRTRLRLRVRPHKTEFSPGTTTSASQVRRSTSTSSRYRSTSTSSRLRPRVRPVRVRPHSDRYRSLDRHFVPSSSSPRRSRNSTPSSSLRIAARNQA